MSQTSNSKIAPEHDASQRNTICLQAVAAILIANSHLEAFYPWGWMAADGLIGNSIFFFLSGYGITQSLLGRKQEFAGYYWRRILRIYPTVWIVTLLFHFLVQGGWKATDVSDSVGWLIYPTMYGYVKQIMVFYILFYLLKSWLRPNTLGKLLVALFLPLLGLYIYELITQPVVFLSLGRINDAFWWLFFFQVMLFGSLTALKKEALAPSPTGAFLKLTVIFLIYVALKYVMVEGWKIPGVGLPWSRLFILLHLLIFPLVYYAYTVGTAKPVIPGLQKSPLAFGLVGLIGGLTLEVYTVHWYVMDISAIRDLRFPMNVAVFFLVTLILSLLVNYAAKGVRRAFDQVPRFVK